MRHPLLLPLLVCAALAGAWPAQLTAQPAETPAAKATRLVAAMVDEKAADHETAEQQLIDMGAASFPALVTALRKGATPELRRRAAFCFMRFGAAAAPVTGDLVAALKDPSADVRLLVARTCGAIGPAAKAAVPVLIPMLKDPGDVTRMRAAEALAGFGPDAREAVPALALLLKDPVRMTKRIAATTLAKIGPDAKAATPALIEALADESIFVVYEVLNTIGSIGPGASAAVPALMKILQGPADGPRQSAAWAVGRMGRDGAVAIPVLKPMIGDAPDFKVSLTAAGSLALLGDAAGMEHVMAALTGPDRATNRRAAATILGLGAVAKAAVPALVAMLPDEEVEHRGMAVLALGAIGPDAKAALVALDKLAASDANADVKKSAAESAKKIRGK